MRWLLVSLFMISSAPVGAETPAGLWLTGPDQKGQVGHIRLSPCGAELCGTVVKAVDRSGRSVVTPNVGKRVIWGLRPTNNGSYSGQMHVSHFKATVKGDFKARGSSMTVKGCLGPVCRSQIWTRLK